MAQHGAEQILLIRNLPYQSNVGLDITDLVGYHTMSMSGLGLPPVERLQRVMPQLHGTIDTGFRLRPRVINIGIFANAQNEKVFHERRRQLMEMLMPGTFEEPIKLRWTYQDNAGTKTRQIDTHLIGGGDMDTTNMIRSNFFDVIQLYAPDPLWYDITELEVQPVYVTPNFDNTQVISLNDQNGWEVYPRIEVTGPFTQVLIQNGSLFGYSILPPSNTYQGEVLYTGLSIPSGEVVTIELKPGKKTISSAGGNRMNQWTGDIATWRLQRGDNNVRFFGTGASSVSRIKLFYKKRFIGE